MSVELINVTKRIKGTAVLTNINLRLKAGRIYGMLGRNGSGKTMLIRMIAGLIRPTQGEVRVFGRQLGKELDFPESLGLIIENVGFWPSYTGLECLRVLAGVKKKIGEAEMRKALERVGLDPSDKRKYYQYSLGMKQKLAIAQAVMEQPDLILLDEPTNSLDEESVEAVREILLQERARGALILVASHNKEDIARLADETLTIAGGELK